MSTPLSVLEKLGACSVAVDFCKAHPDLETAWDKCERADWMLWFAAKRNVDKKIVVTIACECARLALPYTKDPRVLACIETAEKWTRGEATIEEVRQARYGVGGVGGAAAADAACAAAAAYAAYDAAYAAAYAAYAAYAAPDAAYAAARTKVRAQCVAIVKKHLPTLP